MKKNVILDTGPMVAFLNKRDSHHEWAVKIFQEIEPPFLTCEAVLSEACFLLRNTEKGVLGAMEAAFRGLFFIQFSLEREIETIHHLMKKYANIPISLADACLVRMTEISQSSPILTLDSDFLVYRKNSNQIIESIMP